MNNKKKSVLIFLGSGAAMFLIFYFLPMEIFEVRYLSPIAESEQYVTLQGFLGLDAALNEELSATNLEMKRASAGYLLSFICLVGLPFMLAYRSIIIKEPRNKVEQDGPSDDKTDAI